MVFFLFFQVLKETSVSKQWITLSDAAYIAASDLVLHCLPMSLKKDATLIWVNIVDTIQLGNVVP